MRPIHLLSAVLTASVLMLSAACGTTTSVANYQKPLAKKPKFQSVGLKVNTQLAGKEEETRLLDRFVANELLLRRKQLLESGADINVVVTIEHLDGVSQTARLWLGGFAGDGTVRVKVVVTGGDLPDPVVFSIDSRTTGASTSDEWWTGYGGTTQDLLQRAAKVIVDQLL